MKRKGLQAGKFYKFTPTGNESKCHFIIVALSFSRTCEPVACAKHCTKEIWKALIIDVDSKAQSYGLKSFDIFDFCLGCSTLFKEIEGKDLEAAYDEG